jgi:hypothetical protein
MKKFAIILFLVAFAITAVNAQLQVKRGDNFLPNLEADMSTSYKLLNDSLDAHQVVFNIGDKQVLQLYSIAVDLDTILMPAVLVKKHVICLLEKSYDGSNWSTLKTVNYYGTADTTFIHQDVSTGTDAPYLRVRNTMSNDSSSINLISLDAKFTDKL